MQNTQATQENPQTIDGLVGQAYSAVMISNEIPNTLQKARSADPLQFKELLKNQIKILNSEIQETLDALEANDTIEILDGACDVFVVASGLLQLADAKMKAREALLKVTANNLTKFISMFDPNRDKIIEDTVKMYKDQGINVSPVINSAYNMVTFVDEIGKWRKPSTYVPVDISDCV